MTSFLRFDSLLINVAAITCVVEQPGKPYKGGCVYMTLVTNEKLTINGRTLDDVIRAIQRSDEESSVIAL